LNAARCGVRTQRRITEKGGGRLAREGRACLVHSEPKEHPSAMDAVMVLPVTKSATEIEGLTKECGKP